MYILLVSSAMTSIAKYLLAGKLWTTEIPQLTVQFEKVVVVGQLNIFALSYIQRSKAAIAFFRRDPKV